VLGRGDIRVLPFGSTGGGSLFVVRCEGDGVMVLPPGPLKEGRYDGRGRKVKEIAETVPQFLELLWADLVSFVNGNEQHHYIATT
jgi:hypothetical protein